MTVNAEVVARFLLRGLCIGVSRFSAVEPLHNDQTWTGGISTGVA